MTRAERRRRRIKRLLKKPWWPRARRSRLLRKHLDEHGLITPNFSWRSYACQDGTPVPDSLRKNAIRLHWKLERLRHRLGDIPVVVDGPYRTPERNAAVGGASASRHMQADGADFFVAQVNRWIFHGKPADRADVLRIAGRIFWNGGMGNETSGTLHLDARGYRARFVTW